LTLGPGEFVLAKNAGGHDRNGKWPPFLQFISRGNVISAESANE